MELGGNIDSRVAGTLAQILSINLIRSGKYLVYPRTATLEQVQAEYDTQLSGLTADESMVDMGKGDNPQFVLSVGRSVNYDSLDDGIRIMESLAGELAGMAESSLEIIGAGPPRLPRKLRNPLPPSAGRRGGPESQAGPYSVTAF